MLTRELLDHLVSIGVDVPIQAVEEKPDRFIVTLQGGFKLLVEKDLPAVAGGGVPPASPPVVAVRPAGKPRPAGAPRERKK